MNSRVLPLAWFICQLGAAAQIPVDISPGVAAYKERFQNGLSASHRSGWSGTKSPLFPGSEPESVFPGEAVGSPASAAKNWRIGSLPEYEIADDGASDELKAFFEPDLKDAGLTGYTYRKEDDVAIFSAPFDSSSLYKTSAAQLTVPDLITAGLSHAGRHLKPFKGKIEYENHEIGYMNGKIANFRLRFRRIFEGGIVRKNASYVYLKMDGAGNLKEVEFKWPKLIKRSPNMPAISLDEAFYQAKQRYAGLPPITNGMETLKPLGASVSGMSMGWCPIELEGESLLSPCYSFAADVKFEKAVKEPTFIDIPAYAKYQGQ